MKKKLLALALAALAALQAFPAAAEAGFENFAADGRSTAFADVPADAWYAESVDAAYGYGLLDGKSADAFDPDGGLTLAEAVKLAACLHRLYTEGTAAFAPSRPWYQTYADYAREAGVLTADCADWNAAATRAEFALLFAAALPAEALEAVNDVEDGAILDVYATEACADAVYTLYRAGVLAGAEDSRRFRPQAGVRRSEAAAIAARMANPSLRQKFTLHALRALSPAEAETQCMPAVAKLYLYDRNGGLSRGGSGVLISADGLLATAAHCVNGVSRVTAELTDGRLCEAAGIYDMDTTADVALLQLEGGDFPYLTLNTDPMEDAAAYVLGYPGAGAATLTAGRLLDADSRQGSAGYLESNAEAHSGSSGGAMIDGYGRLIGVVSAVSGGMHASVYAAPAAALQDLSTDTLTAVADYARAHAPAEADCYSGFYPVPDLGKLFGIDMFAQTARPDGAIYYYRLSDLGQDAQTAVNRYRETLNAHTFYQFEGAVMTSSAGYPCSVALTQTIYYGEPALSVSVARLSHVFIGGLPQTPAAAAVRLISQNRQKTGELSDFVH